MPGMLKTLNPKTLDPKHPKRDPPPTGVGSCGSSVVAVSLSTDDVLPPGAKGIVG